VEKKGFADLIDACAILANKGCDFHCEIIGTGELEDDLYAQIERLGLNDRVEMIGPRPQGEVIAHLQTAAVFAAPCVVGEDGNRDGLPTVLLEAMALGTPCIATDVTGIPEVLRDGETGLMVPQHDPARLADAIERLLNDRALGQRLATEARDLIEQSFDIHRNTAKLRALFGVPEHARIEAVGGLR
jgi:glycosyltransferase involved in cell wall biosynthesis